MSNQDHGDWFQCWHVSSIYQHRRQVVNNENVFRVQLIAHLQAQLGIITSMKDGKSQMKIPGKTVIRLAKQPRGLRESSTVLR